MSNFYIKCIKTVILKRYETYSSLICLTIIKYDQKHMMSSFIIILITCPPRLDKKPLYIANMGSDKTEDGGSVTEKSKYGIVSVPKNIDQMFKLSGIAFSRNLKCLKVVQIVWSSLGKSGILEGPFWEKVVFWENFAIRRKWCLIFNKMHKNCVEYIWCLHSPSYSLYVLPG